MATINKGSLNIELVLEKHKQVYYYEISELNNMNNYMYNVLCFLKKLLWYHLINHTPFYGDNQLPFNHVYDYDFHATFHDNVLKKINLIFKNNTC